MSSLNYKVWTPNRQEPRLMAINIITIREFCELSNYNSCYLSTKKDLNFSQTKVPKRKPISLNLWADTHNTDREREGGRERVKTWEVQKERERDKAFHIWNSKGKAW